MRLVKFRVTNFKSVDDSGWVEADRVTALIGVNESGKTNLLLPLWKLNPARDGEIRPTSDYRKAIYTEIKANPDEFAFICAEFNTVDFAEKLAALTARDPAQLNPVQVTRFFSGKHSISFPNCPLSATASGAEVKAKLAGTREAIAATQPRAKEASSKAGIMAALEQAEGELDGHAELSAEMLSRLAADLAEALPRSPVAANSVAASFQDLLTALDSMSKDLNGLRPEDVDGVHELVLSSLPKFVYYSNYGNLDSEIYLPHVVENMQREENLGAKEAAKARTLRVLFNFVRLQPKEILALGLEPNSPQQPTPTADEIARIANNKRERTILLNSAGTSLTAKFRNWWKQGDYTFEFQADGNHFRIWVSDQRRPDKVELEDRSTGLQWFFSFYLVFLVESEGKHQDAILLLDEPGLSLHPLAQRDLSTFFANLSKTNQLLYTTHSPFLVDSDMLDRVRKMYVAEDGTTRASSDLRRGDKDPRRSGATYAIYSALGMSVAESILHGCHPVIVEGPSDQHYLTAIKTILIARSKLAPKREVIFPPAHGASSAKAVASMLSGKDEELPYMLLDGDAAGRKMAADVQNGLYQSCKDRVLTTDKFAGFSESEIEDLVPPEFMADVIDRWERKPDTSFSETRREGLPIVPQIKMWAEQHGVGLSEGWKVELAREVKKRALAKPTSFDEKCIERWVALFQSIGAS